MKPGYQDGMQREVARGIIARATGRGVTLEIPCTGGHIAEFHMDKMLPPDAMPRQLARRGWILERRKATCPDHATKEKLEMPEAVAPAPATAEQTLAAKRVHRTVMEALSCVYDDDTKRYTDGYTDERVAKESGAAVEYIRKTREDYFGPIAEPDGIVELRADHAALIASNAQVRKDWVTVRTTIESRLDEMDTSARNVLAQIDKLAAANGWKR